MDVVTFHGRSYVKATVLASRYRYSTDYLGQLARGKKIDARLVGRAWYINEDSLLEHRKGRYKAIESEITNEKTSNNYLSRVAVEPYVKSKTARLVLGNDGLVTNTKITYEPDSESLIPPVNKTVQSTKVRVEIAEAETVKISSDKRASTQFKPEQLPEVYLKGTVKIKDISDDDEIEAESIAKPTPAIEHPIEKPLPVPVQRQMDRKVVTVRRPVRKFAPTVSAKPSQVLAIPTRQTVVPQSFSPQYLSKPVASKAPTFKYPLLALLSGLFVGLALLATTSDLLVTATETIPVWEISVHNLLQFLP